MMDAGLLTAIRTAAASAVATRALAREGACRLALIGTGEQARHHLGAICAVRPLRAVHIVGRRPEAAEAFADAAARAHPDLAVSHGTDARCGIRGADIICTLTNAATPVLMGDWLEPGQHLNVVGASVPSKREIDDAAVLRAALFTDYRPSCLAQAGEVVAMLAAGAIGAEHLRAEIGAVLSGEACGRRHPDEITLYRSLGIVAQDLAVAWHVLQRAEAEGRGQLVSL